MQLDGNVIDNFRIFIKNTNKEFVFKGRNHKDT